MNSISKKYKKLYLLILSLHLMITVLGCSQANNSNDNENQQNDVISEDELLDDPLTNEEIPSDIDGEESSPDDAVVENDNYVLVENDSEEETNIDPVTRNSINVLNYMTSLTQRVNKNRKNQLYLESAYNFFDNIYPNAVDNQTHAEIINIMDTIQEYRMIAVKRDRLKYIYEQNKAQNLRKAFPNPVGLLSVVQSGNLLKGAISALYMAADSINSYTEAASQTDLQFIKDGWELDDAEAETLHDSTKKSFSYMIKMVQDYGIPGDFALSESDIENFVSYSSKPDSAIQQKISWLKTKESVYSEFGPYWLELAKSYYKLNEYKNCLDSIKQYENKQTKIFRKDKEYADILPLGIISAKELLTKEKYVSVAKEYCERITENITDDDWSLRYFVSQIYLDLYHQSNGEKIYLETAYNTARENVVVLVDKQKQLNTAYLADIQKQKPSKKATKREKKEIKEYNNFLEDERKIALPPVNEALYLNVDLLFALANELGINDNEKHNIDSILHENNEMLFLSDSLDSKFWFYRNSTVTKKNNKEIVYEKSKIVIPASYLTDRWTVSVEIKGNQNVILNDWLVKKVKRPKTSKDVSEFTVTLESEKAKKYDYKDGEKVFVRITEDRNDNNIVDADEIIDEFTFVVTEFKHIGMIPDVKFERSSE